MHFAEKLFLMTVSVFFFRFAIGVYSVPQNYSANFQRRAEREQQEVYEKAIHHATLRSTGGMSGTSNDQAFIWQKLHKEANEIEQRAKQLGSSHLHHKPLRQAAKDLRSSSSFGFFHGANHAAYPRRQ